MTNLIEDGFWFTSTMVWFPFEGLDGERIAKGYEDAVSVRSFLAADQGTDVRKIPDRLYER